VRFFANAASVLVANSFLAVIGLLTSIALARLLGVAEFGHYSVAISVALVGVLLGQLGWQAAVIYRMRRLGRDPAIVFGAATVAMLLMGVVVVVLASAFQAWLRDAFLAGTRPALLHMALALVPVHLLGNAYAAIARGCDRFDLSNGFKIVRAVLFLVVAALVLGAFGGDAADALGYFLGASAVATAGLALLVGRETGVRFAELGTELRASVAFGAKSYAQHLAGQIHERLDLLMIASLLADPLLTGFYAIAVRVIDRLKLVPDALGASLFPKVAGLAEDEAGRLTAYVSRHSVLWVVATVAALGLLAPVFVPLLFGEEYVASIPPLLVLLFAMALLTVYRLLSRYFVAVGRQTPNVVTQILSTALNFGLNLLWIPRYGILGAAYASLVSYALETVLITIAFRLDSGQPLRDTLVIRRGDFAEYSRRLRPLLTRLGFAR
jgi:O-antigen/teichoic acid export membrane protein